MEHHGESRVLRPSLGLWDTISIILGIVIGAGIYETAPLVFQNVSSISGALGIWLLGGVLSLIGALCYAELATRYPRSGGDYVYLGGAYGRWAGFLFGWAQLTVLMTGSIGMMGYIFADYAINVFGFGAPSAFICAAAPVVALTLLNVFGVVCGKRVQNALTGVKVLGIAAILLAGFFWAHPHATHAVRATGSGSLGLALILVLYTYGGWNDAAFVAAEISNASRTIPRALVGGILLIMSLYLAINAAYLYGIGLDQARASQAIAAEVLEQGFGSSGATAISLLVIISALGAMNGLIYTGSRIYSTMGEDHRLFAPLANWNTRRHAPVSSLLVQAVITVLLMALVGTPFGRRLLQAVAQGIGLGKLEWQGHGGFETLLRGTAPLFWLFVLLTTMALFVLRRKNQTPRPFSVPLYPVLPLIFCAVCAYMLYSAIVYAGMLLVIGLVPLTAGILIYGIACISNRGS